MEKQFWIEKWKKRDIGFHGSAVNPMLAKHFKELSLSEGNRVFLPLCGKTLDIPWLLSKGLRVAGVELYEPAVQELFQELGQDPQVERREGFLRYRAEGLEVYVGDFFGLSADILGPVDAVYDRAALVALPEEMRLRYAPHLTAVTRGAPQLLITYEYDPKAAPGPPFSISAEEVHRHYGRGRQVRELDRVAVAGGFRGKHEAWETVWSISRE